MEIFVLGKKYLKGLTSMTNKLGVLDDVQSIQWLSQHCDSGEISITAKATTKNKELLIPGNLLKRSDINEWDVALILYAQINNGVMTVRGTLDPLKYIVNNTVVNATDVYAGVNSLFSISSIKELPCYSLVDSGVRYAFSNIQTSWDTISKSIQLMCSQDESGSIGYRKLGIGTYYLYQGKMIEKNVLSEDSGYITNIKITYDQQSAYSVAIVAGEGEGANRKTVIVTNPYCQPDFYSELYVDARDIQSTYSNSDGTVTSYTDEQYNELLRARGLEKLKETSTIKNISCDMDMRSSHLEYRRDFQLGDYMKVKLKDYGKIVCQIKSSTETFEKGNKITSITLAS